jgi:hypothetical protein
MMTKTKHTFTPSDEEEDVIIVKVGEEDFICSKSTLRSVPDSYLAVRFGSGPVPCGGYVGDHADCGLPVYFIDRDGGLFRYVLSYLRCGVLELPPFASNKALWRSLRREADFYLLDNLCAVLHVSSAHRFLYTGDGNGVFSWMGHGFHNPHACAASSYKNPVKHRMVRLIVNEKVQRSPFIETQCFISNKIEYKRRVQDMDAPEELNVVLYADGYSDFMACDVHDGSAKQWIGVDLLSFEVKLTHYTLYYADCYGATDWNLEASQDGTTWVVLHEVRQDKHLFKDPSCHSYQKMSTVVDRGGTQEEVLRQMSHTFKVPESDLAERFYKSFRIASLDREVVRSEERQESQHEDWHMCVHVCGFEIYGDVHEP